MWTGCKHIVDPLLFSEQANFYKGISDKGEWQNVFIIWCDSIHVSFSLHLLEMIQIFGVVLLSQKRGVVWPYIRYVVLIFGIADSI